MSRRYLVEENPDAILNIVDGTNIERNLYLSTQLAELGIPMVVAVNMMDVVKKNGDKIDFGKIAKVLRCEVVGISALKNEGGLEAAQKTVEMAKKKVAERGPGKQPDVPHVFTGSVEHAIAHIEESIQGKVPQRSIRWYAIKIFERDREVVADLDIGVGLMKHLEEHIRDCEKELDDDAESIITNQRYEFIKNLLDKALSRSEKRKNKASLSDRIDKIVTNRILALPIFILSLCAMWWLAVAENGPGTILTDWANDGFLGEDGHHRYVRSAFVHGVQPLHPAVHGGDRRHVPRDGLQGMGLVRGRPPAVRRLHALHVGLSARRSVRRRRIRHLDCRRDPH